MHLIGLKKNTSANWKRHHYSHNYHTSVTTRTSVPQLQTKHHYNTSQETDNLLTHLCKRAMHSPLPHTYNQTRTWRRSGKLQLTTECTTERPERIMGVENFKSTDNTKQPGCNSHLLTPKSISPYTQVQYYKQKENVLICKLVMAPLISDSCLVSLLYIDLTVLEHCNNLKGTACTWADMRKTTTTVWKACCCNRGNISLEVLNKASFVVFCPLFT